MRGKEQYQQGALNFQKPEPPANGSPRRQERSPAAPVHRSASSRLPDDLIPEYLFDLQNRERLNLPTVSLEEFEDMRDFADGITVYGDIGWPQEQPSYARAPRREEPAEPNLSSQPPTAAKPQRRYLPTSLPRTAEQQQRTGKKKR